MNLMEINNGVEITSSTVVELTEEEKASSRKMELEAKIEEAKLELGKMFGQQKGKYPRKN